MEWMEREEEKKERKSFVIVIEVTSICVLKAYTFFQLFLVLSFFLHSIKKREQTWLTNDTLLSNYLLNLNFNVTK
jgi:heme/copper-type cytochrome/quinol oxidase subunit 4